MLLQEEGSGFRGTAAKIEKRAWGECEGKAEEAEGDDGEMFLGEVLKGDIMGRMSPKLNVTRELVVIK